MGNFEAIIAGKVARICRKLYKLQQTHGPLSAIFCAPLTLIKDLFKVLGVPEKKAVIANQEFQKITIAASMHRKNI